MAFQESAVDSARLYYDYLLNKGRGIVEYRVLEISSEPQSIRNNEYWLLLDRNIKDIDRLKVKINALTYEQEQIKPIIFDERNRRLKVSLSRETAGVFTRVDPKHVIVFSDLKFLVERIEAWYKSYGKRIRLPSGKQVVDPADCSKLKKTPSSDQSQAIHGILENPFTYIWGAPGTGKTQFVLARAVLAYIQAGKRVLVAAPTNNAVEQTLYGLLPVLEAAGLDYSKLVVRLGIASAGFAERYSGVCEDSWYSRAISELLSKIVFLSQEKERADEEKSLLLEYLAFQKQLAVFHDAQQKLDILLPQLIEAAKQANTLSSTISFNEKEMAKMSTALEEASSYQQHYNRSAQELMKRINKPFHRLRSRSKRENDRSRLDSALDRARYYEEKHAKIAAELNAYRANAEQAKSEYEEAHSFFIALRSEAADLVSFSAKLHAMALNIQEKDLIGSINRFTSTLKDDSRELSAREEKYISVKGADLDSIVIKLEELDHEIEALTKRKKELEQADPSKRIEGCLVIACTIDTCLNRFWGMDRPLFSHVFLDEAGYCPLIKAVTLTAYADRVTFLGDHMQLPPVCEADEKEIDTEKWHLIAFWAQSALFTETVFSKTAAQICCDYLQKEPIPSQNMVRFDLLLSYRFGESLAQVLAGNIYSCSFRGNNAHNTRIFYVDAPKQPEPNKRENHAEAAAIQTLLLKGGFTGSSGIITPYRNQVVLLRQSVKNCHFSPDNVITVHQSQGREWDNVFLSVSDTADKYFTNSLNPKSDGKRIINTAVSRAKRNLIIVCDYQYWIRQKGQLIGKLLAIAENYSLSKQ